MNHDAAMRILGLKDTKSKNSKGVLVIKRLEDHTEEEILQAFQKESASYSKQLTFIQLYHNQNIGEMMLTLNSFQLAKVRIKRCKIATKLTRCC